MLADGSDLGEIAEADPIVAIDCYMALTSAQLALKLRFGDLIIRFHARSDYCVRIASHGPSEGVGNSRMSYYGQSEW